MFFGQEKKKTELKEKSVSKWGLRNCQDFKICDKMKAREFLNNHLRLIKTEKGG